MAKIRVVTDSTADIPEEARKALGIEVVPLKVHFGEETYLDGVTLHSSDFYPLLARSEVMPTTSQPSPADFLEVYRRILGEGADHILSIHISSRMSGTHQSAEIARSLLDGDEERVTVIDSRWASYGIGMLAMAAAEAAQQGRNLQECMERVRQIRDRTRVYFLVDTLEYLHRGGRIGKAAALVGSLLNIKPILSIDDEGEVTSVDKVRGSKKAIARIVELFKQEFSGQEVDVSIVHANDPSSAESLLAVLREHFAVQNSVFSAIGPVIGTHTGPGTIGIFMGPALS